MRVALTGAEGFTGRFVSAALARAGAEPVILKVDLTDANAVDHEVDRTRFDRVIHLAGAAFAGGIDWHAFYMVNQLGTLNLLNAVARSKPGIRCILASSAQVYGPRAQGLIAEDAPVSPANHYAISKRAMEQGADLWRGKLDIVITRPFNYSGVGQDVQYLIPKLVDHFRRRADAIDLGNTWVERDFGDVRSVAAAYVGLILAEDVPDMVNICTGTVSSIGYLLEQLGAISGHRIDVRVNPAFVRAGDVPVLGGNSARLRAALPNWRPHTITDTLRWMFESQAEPVSG